MNLFKELIVSGRIRTKDDLKKYYRRLAIKLHPDSANNDFSDEPFMQLHDDYEEARSWVSEYPEPRRVVKREEILQLFWELIASGFPVDISIRGTSKLYLARIAVLSSLISEYGPLGEYSFADLEEEMYAIRGDDIVSNLLFGKIRMIFYNVVAWHLEPRKFTRKAIEKWFAEIGEELIERRFVASYAFIKWLVDDMRNGNALTTK
jgi:hypothetical protein